MTAWKSYLLGLLTGFALGAVLTFVFIGLAT